MDTVVFGRTGLERQRRRASVAEDTAGSASRTARASTTPCGSCAARSDLGINYIDTAHAYGTEEIVGQAVRGPARRRGHLHQDLSA